MRLIALVVALVLASGAPTALQTSPSGGGFLTLLHTTIVDVAAGRLLPDQNVVIQGDRIARMGRATSTPPQGRVVDASSKYLMPGLWDMHSHLFDVDTPGSTAVTFPLLIANGITGVRDTGAMLDLLLYWRDQVDTRTVIGPRIVGTGPLLDGLPVVYPLMSMVLQTADDSRRAVDALADRGADFVKVYEMLRPEVFAAIVEQAKQRRIPAIGHVPLSIDAGEASDAGMRSFEHLRNLELACSSEADSLRQSRTALLAASSSRSGGELRNQIHWSQRPRAVDTYDPQRCSALLARLARNHTWQVPTLFLNSREALRPDKSDRVRSTLRFVPEVDRRDWEQWSTRVTNFTPDEVRQRSVHTAWQTRLVRQMSENGVGLLAGTDISVQWIVPGFSLHEELRTLVDAGLTPLQALRTATLNPAAYFETTELSGAVRAGQVADLVLLDANPLSDIRNTEAIRAVITRGRYLDRAMLNRLLANAEESAKQPDEARPKRPNQRLQPSAPGAILKRRG